MQITLARLGFSRASAASFKPRINLRAQATDEQWAFLDWGYVVRYGVMPDGREVSLGRTVDRDLNHAREQYWRRLFLAGFLAWVPRPFRWAVKRWYPIEVKGYEMTPLSPLKGDE